MVLYRATFLILFIPMAIGVDTTESKAETSANTKSGTNILASPEISSSKATNKSTSDFSLISEGQYTVPLKTESGKEPKKNTTTLQLNTQIETLIDDSAKIKNKAVKPRKGVDFNLLDNTKPDNTTKGNEISTEKPSPKGINAKVNLKKPTSNAVEHKSNVIVAPVVPKKPLLLDSLALDNTNKMFVPDKRGGAPLKQPTNPGSHPGMIMPVVITILVVPMFAVLGYMALRRGQEAWKNRHYKRMDFLLDGMYND